MVASSRLAFDAVEFAEITYCASSRVVAIQLLGGQTKGYAVLA
ncbi:hypothetical protein DFR28_105114 [Arenicella xantha]|uniref:KTSC domain-containing protein n=1 Tax=Arenicella xantha TaxID=644221 RepID=A0A395JH58_9GAMM|nr:hypothetical protein DFR28_105114 [Arenicella xantha]